jgi:rare lipoprotein A
VKLAGPPFTLAGLAALVMSFAGCMHKPPPPPPLVASPHYQLGNPYQADGHWYYPAENYALDATGIATIAPMAPDPASPGPVSPSLTADGEIADAGALTAAMQTIQLPAIAAVTNLANGRQILLRVNDRGPSDPARLIALSPRAAFLLQVPQTGAPVRVQVDTVLSHRLIDQLGGGPHVAIAAAPKSRVTAQALPPPGSSAPAGPAAVLGAARPEAHGPPVPDRMPEIIHLGPIYGGEYWLHAGTFGRFQYANMVAARLGGLGGDVVASRQGRQAVYAVRAGPFRSIAEADAALRRALASGIPDAVIRYE